MTIEHKPATDHVSPGIGFERMVFFSDAVFAIAITLLVLDLRLPAPAHGVIDFARVVPQVLGFLISFFVIGIYWMTHHKLFEGLARYDETLLRVNLLFLAAIAFLPFPTSVVTQPGATTPAAVIFYAGSVATIGILQSILVLTARRASLLRPGETRGGTVRAWIRSLPTPLVFIGTIFVALNQPALATRLWLLLFPAGYLAGLIGRWAQRRVDRNQAEGR